MPKLFIDGDVKHKQLSMEEFLQYHKSSVTVSQEAASDFLYKTKDVLFNINARLFSGDMDRVAIDATKHRFQVLNAAKRVHIAHLSDEIITVPESFKGRLTDYVDSLIECSEEIFGDTEQLLSNLKMAVAGFINEYREDGVMTIYGAAYTKASNSKLDKAQKTMKKYFTVSKPVSKAPVTEVIRSLGDVDTLYNKVSALSAATSDSRIKAISKLSSEVSDIIDVLIEQNKDADILTKNSSSKKELIEMIHTAARAIEFCGYLSGNAQAFYKTLQELSQAVILVANR